MLTVNDTSIECYGQQSARKAVCKPAVREGGQNLPGRSASWCSLRISRMRQRFSPSDVDRQRLFKADLPSSTVGILERFHRESPNRLGPGVDSCCQRFLLEPQPELVTLRLSSMWSIYSGTRGIEHQAIPSGSSQRKRAMSVHFIAS